GTHRQRPAQVVPRRNAPAADQFPVGPRDSHHRSGRGVLARAAERRERPMSDYEHPSELTGLEVFACARQLLNVHHTAEAAEQELINRGVPPGRAKEVVATLVAQRTRQAMDRKTQQLLQSNRPPEEVARQLMERGLPEDQARS